MLGSVGTTTKTMGAQELFSSRPTVPVNQSVAAEADGFSAGNSKAETSFADRFRQEASAKSKPSEKNTVREKANDKTNSPSEDDDQVNPYAAEGRRDDRPQQTTRKTYESVQQSSGAFQNQKKGMSQDTGPLSAEQRAMAKFFRSMEIEVGVKPGEVVEAFAQLDRSSLEASPEATVDQLIEKLDLTAPQEERAKLLYENMLFDTATVRADQEKAQTGINLEVLTPDQQKVYERMAAVDAINKGFQATPVNQAKGQSDEGFVPVPVRAPVSTQEALLRPEFRQKFSTRILNDDLEQAGVVNGLAPVGIESVLEEGLVVPEGDVDPLALEGGEEAPAEHLESLLQKLEQSTNNLAAPMSQTLQKESRDSSSSGGKGNKQERQSVLKGEGIEALNSGFKPEMSKGTLPKLDGVPGLRVSAEDQVKNADQLVNSARLLVKNGGGEMKVQMNPEGLGPVNMKVNVNNGKVDIQMITENIDAKRVLENGLDDLRVGLNQHKLSLDTLKVDVGNRSESQFGQNQNQFNQGQESARDFLQQFHQFNDQRRDAFMGGMTGGAGFGPKVKGPDFPEEAVNQKKGRQAKANGRLDLVA